jgi:hypothetical protein
VKLDNIEKDHISVTHVFWGAEFKIHSQENKYVDRRFSSIDFGLPGGVSSSRHDKHTPLGLIFAANLQKSRHPRFQNVPQFPSGIALAAVGVAVRGFWDGKAGVGWEPRRVSHPFLETGRRQFYDQ